MNEREQFTFAITFEETPEAILKLQATVDKFNANPQNYRVRAKAIKDYLCLEILPKGTEGEYKRS